MRGMSFGPGRTAACLLFAFALAGCGGGASLQTESFVGTWSFESGMLTPVCPGLATAPFSLVGLSVTLTQIDSSTLSLEAGTAGCTVTFKVSGGKATAPKDQSCTLETGSALGQQIIGIDSWTLTLSGAQITSETSGSVAICTAAGSGVLVRATPDGGAD
jgi:hypothetical protein